MANEQQPEHDEMPPAIDSEVLDRMWKIHVDTLMCDKCQRGPPTSCLCARKKWEEDVWYDDTQKFLEKEGEEEKEDEQEEEASNTSEWRKKKVEDSEMYVITVNDTPYYYTKTKEQAIKQMWEMANHIVRKNLSQNYSIVFCRDNYIELQRPETIFGLLSLGNVTSYVLEYHKIIQIEL